MTSFSLKVIALIAMTLDHIARVIGQLGLMSIFPNLSLVNSYHISQILEVCGRLAFPIFAFLVAEGARKSHNLGRYFGRLLLFAIISVPFYTFAHTSYDSKHSEPFKTFISCLTTPSFVNVLFIFAISIAVIIVFNAAKEHIPNQVVVYAVFTISLILGCGIAHELSVEYDVAGVLLVILLYFVPSSRAKISVVLLWSFAFYGTLMVNSFHATTQIIHISFLILGSVLSCIPIKFYNGEKGLSCKWLFYIYYPAHFLVLSVIASLL